VNLLLLYLVTAFESAGTGILQRGIYFYAHDRLGFGQLANLSLALAYGACYVAGAFGSHPAATRLGVRRLLVVALVGLFVVHAALTLAPTVWVLCIGFVISAGLRGLKWPLFESYVSAGRTPGEILSVVGKYNVSWAIAMPVAVGISGPLISGPWPFLMFALPCAINVGSLAVVRYFPANPSHLDDTHPERLAASELARYGDLLISARWSLLAAYGLLFLLAPLMPDIFQRIGVGIAWATPAASLYDVVRVSAFVVLGRIGSAWRGRTAPLVVSAVLLPIGFFLVLFAPSLGAVLVGELIFGGASGFVYTAALYYALVVKNASVDAGGAHEGLIGLGLGLGPLAGIVGYELAGRAASSFTYVEGMLIGIAPLIFACIVGSMWPVPRLLRAPASPP
jgi:predicted MFS family arabinose efflux permease